MKPTAVRFDVRVQGGEIIVTLADFCAIYVKPSTLSRTLSSTVGRRQQITKPSRERGKLRMTRLGSWVGSSRRSRMGSERGWR